MYLVCVVIFDVICPSSLLLLLAAAPPDLERLEPLPLGPLPHSKHLTTTMQFLH